MKPEFRKITIHEHYSSATKEELLERIQIIFREVEGLQNVEIDMEVISYTYIEYPQKD
jgi:hypothetical protein